MVRNKSDSETACALICPACPPEPLAKEGHTALKEIGTNMNEPLNREYDQLEKPRPKVSKKYWVIHGLLLFIMKLAIRHPVYGEYFKTIMFLSLVAAELIARNYKVAKDDSFWDRPGDSWRMKFAMLCIKSLLLAVFMEGFFKAFNYCYGDGTWEFEAVRERLRKASSK